MRFEMTPETADDVVTYANHAINDIRDLQDRMRANAKRLGFHGAQLHEAADMLDDVIHDALDQMLKHVENFREDEAASIACRQMRSDRAAYHSRVL